MKVAIIGAGRMGQRHLEVVRLLGYETIGVSDISAKNLTDTAEKFSLDPSQLHLDPHAFISSGNPDCVIIATTAESHCELVCAAAQAGAKFILVEKPMATSLSDCQKMIDICKKTGSRLSVNHQMQFLDQYITPKMMLNSKEYGGLSSMTVTAGNFGMAMNGLHYIEAFRFMSEEDPKYVSAWFSAGKVANPRGVQFEDKAGCIRVITPKGVRLYIDASEDQGNGVMVTYAGRNGMIQVNELSGELTAFARTSEYIGEPTTRYGLPSAHEKLMIPPVELIDSTANVLRSLVSGINYVQADYGMNAIKVLEAGYRSSESFGKQIELNGDTNQERKFPWA